MPLSSASSSPQPPWEFSAQDDLPCDAFLDVPSSRCPEQTTRDAACKRAPCLERSVRFCSRSRLSTQRPIRSARVRRDARTLRTVMRHHRRFSGRYASMWRDVTLDRGGKRIRRIASAFDEFSATVVTQQQQMSRNFVAVIDLDWSVSGNRGAKNDHRSR